MGKHIQGSGKEETAPWQEGYRGSPGSDGIRDTVKHGRGSAPSAPGPAWGGSSCRLQGHLGTRGPPWLGSDLHWRPPTSATSPEPTWSTESPGEQGGKPWGAEGGANSLSNVLRRDTLFFPRLFNDQVLILIFILMTSHDRYWQSLPFKASGILGSFGLPSESAKFGLYISELFSTVFRFPHLWMFNESCHSPTMTWFQDPDTLHTMCYVQQHFLLFFPFTNNLLFSCSEMLSQEPGRDVQDLPQKTWHKALAQVVIDILETYLILRQSDQCSRVGGCQDYIGIRERVG